MKVLLLNGSPHANGCTRAALAEVERTLQAEGVETECLHVAAKPVRGCIGCGSCAKNGKCVFDDAVNEAAALFAESDGLVVGSPVYFASANATLVAFLTRLFYSTPFDKTMKVGAAVVAARRGGLSATFDELNKFFTISGGVRAVLEQHSWQSAGGGASGCGRITGDAYPGSQHGFSDEKHCPRQRNLWSA